MARAVKTPASPARGRRQAARTERLIIAAATRLFLERGYTATTVEDIAAAADVGARTVYVRFATKAALFKRVVDAAIVGDTERRALEAPTAADRIAASASAARRIMERTGALFAVAQQAAAVEPLIEAAWQEGREGSRQAQRVVWTRMADDGLLPPSCDLDWIIDTASVLGAAETYLFLTRTTGWSLDAYEDWLRVTLGRLTGAR